VTISATMFTQSAGKPVDGTNNTYAPPQATTCKTADIIQILGTDTGHNFSPVAKLALIDGQAVVIDGATLVSVTNLVSISTVGVNRIKSGTQNGDTNLGFPTLKKLELMEFDFDDTGVGGDFHFYMTGLSRLSFTDTEPTSTGTYTETYKAKVGSMAGEGSDQNGPFVITGSLSIAGKGTLGLK
jgi:hypothetical protein